MNDNYTAILSDLDGVLVDSGDSIETTWTTWAVSRGVDPALLEGRIHGRPARDVIREIAPHLNAIAENAAICQMDIDGPPALVLDGARRLLNDDLGLPVAVVTSCPDALAHVRLTTAALRIPDVLVTSDRVTAGKPDPEGYRLAATELGIDPAGAVVFEDAPAGIAAGKAAGAHVIGITTTHPPAELFDAGADATAESVAAALEQLSL
jgi:mannitol-1-/sugar-/sorbitol-6-phosphatase